MRTQQILEAVEASILKVTRDIERRGAGGDKIEALSKLVNSYSRLLVRGKSLRNDDDDCEPFSEEWLMEHGDPTYAERLEAGDPQVFGLRRLKR